MNGDVEYDSNSNETTKATQAVGINLTASTVIVKILPNGGLNTSLFLQGIVINSNTSGIVALSDGTTFASGTLKHSSITFASTEHFIPFFGEVFKNGIAINIGGTANITLMYR